ncbi:MAG: hypothetical protein AB1Z98_38570, partial [Nannocystaceae bacterium]
NDDDGSQLLPGLHQLRVMVTDRPWYRPPLLDASGEPVIEDGEPQLDEPIVGMPDLPAGASYDTATYVFRCFDDNNDLPAGIECDCEA